MTDILWYYFFLNLIANGFKSSNLIHRNVAFTHSNTQPDIAELKNKNMPFAWICVFN